jgi:hypothetical protein
LTGHRLNDESWALEEGGSGFLDSEAARWWLAMVSRVIGDSGEQSSGTSELEGDE